MVAEKSIVCRGRGTFARMRVSWGLKPMSSMRSASSSTSTSMFESTAVPWPMWSSNRPGVATQICECLRPSICCPMPTPPMSTTVFTPCGAPKRCECSAICSANSRVGANTSARSPFLLWGLWWRRSTMGNTNAAVLPVPVAAQPMMSLPWRAWGMVCAWMGVGFS